MKSHLTKDFRICFAELPERIQHLAKENYKLWESNPSTISGIENDRIGIGVERAKILAKALNCHPAVLVFPGWELKESKAA